MKTKYMASRTGRADDNENWEVMRLACCWIMTQSMTYYVVSWLSDWPVCWDAVTNLRSAQSRGCAGCVTSASSNNQLIDMSVNIRRHGDEVFTSSPGVTYRRTDRQTRGEMPRVVDDQRHKFYNDELFRKLSRESEVSLDDTCQSRLSTQ